MKRIITLLVLLLPICSFTGGAADLFAPVPHRCCAGLKNYQCKKCGTLVKTDRTPSSYGCPSGGSHQWQDLGEVGNVNYQCKKCASHVESRRQPSSYGCPAGGSHQWQNLGNMGASTYQCRKCSLVLQSERQPSSSGCPAKGSHQWTKLSR